MSDATIWMRAYVTMNQYRVSWQSTQVVWSAERELAPLQRMESQIEKKLLGIMTQSVQVKGYVQGLAERAFMESLANQAYMWTQIHHANGAIGEGALILRGAFNKFMWQNEHGAVEGFENDMNVNDGVQVMLGSIMWNTFLTAGAAPIAVATNSTPVELPALAAGYLGRFLISFPDPDPITGTTPTLDGVLESDVDATFATPTTRGTLTQVTTDAAYQGFDFDGDVAPITDTFWRWKISAIGGTGTPSYHIIAAGAVNPRVS